MHRHPSNATKKCFGHPLSIFLLIHLWNFFRHCFGFSLHCAANKWQFLRANGRYYPILTSYLSTQLQYRLSINATSKLHCFQLRTTLNGKDFKFGSHRLWSEEQNILLPHMHKNNFGFWLLNVEISLNTKTRLGGMAPRFHVLAYFHIYWSKSKIIFYACVEEGCSAPPTIS